MRLAFETIHGISVPAVTAARMQEICRVACQDAGLLCPQVVENAGRSLASTAIRMLGSHWMESRILVLAGQLNGAAGICAARHLANRGAAVSLCLSHPRRLSEGSTSQHRAYRATGSSTVSARQLPGDDFDLVVDALTGAVEEPAPSGVVRDLIQWANDIGAPLLSLDAPSGVNASTGEHPGSFIRATQTMTLGLPKTGLLPHLTGSLTLADIGIPLGVFSRLGICYTPPFGVDYVVALRALPTA
ncbi:MAG: NAD(P)H-hydrate epimerase [Bryobacterales bacterium]|jgi:NAD(P)H-hydrate epimerase|nr:NAD(P)H-hydrate epimerase [Bryobacterales bacterium]